MGLLRLDPEVIEQVISLGDAIEVPGVTERALRPLTKTPPRCSEHAPQRGCEVSVINSRTQNLSGLAQGGLWISCSAERSDASRVAPERRSGAMGRVSLTASDRCAC